MQEVTKETFEQEVLCADSLVMVDFWGPQCAPCLALMPKIEGLDGKYGDSVKIVKVEAQKNRRLCLSLKILSLPTFLFFKEGEEIERLTGNGLTIESLEETINLLR